MHCFNPAKHSILSHTHAPLHGSVPHTSALMGWYAHTYLFGSHATKCDASAWFKPHGVTHKIHKSENKKWFM